MSQREVIQQEIFDEINEENSKYVTELSSQEEVDMNDTPGLKYNIAFNINLHLKMEKIIQNMRLQKMKR